MDDHGGTVSQLTKTGVYAQNPSMSVIELRHGQLERDGLTVCLLNANLAGYSGRVLRRYQRFLPEKGTLCPCVIRRSQLGEFKDIAFETMACFSNDPCPFAGFEGQHRIGMILSTV
jgi:NAD-specific glutamate dehydrogenase